MDGINKTTQRTQHCRQKYGRYRHADVINFKEGVSQINPIFYYVSAFRYGLLGYSGLVNLMHAFLVMGVVVMVFFGYSLYLLNTGKGFLNPGNRTKQACIILRNVVTVHTQRRSFHESIHYNQTQSLRPLPVFKR
jgi:hypothetical protein